MEGSRTLIFVSSQIVLRDHSWPYAWACYLAVLEDQAQLKWKLLAHWALSHPCRLYLDMASLAAALRGYFLSTRPKLPGNKAECHIWWLLFQVRELIRSHWLVLRVYSWFSEIIPDGNWRTICKARNWTRMGCHILQRQTPTQLYYFSSPQSHIWMAESTSRIWVPGSRRSGTRGNIN